MRKLWKLLHCLPGYRICCRGGMNVKKLMKGNNALAEAAILAGCRFFAGYPITPQTEILEYLAKNLPERGGHFVQT